LLARPLNPAQWARLISATTSGYIVSWCTEIILLPRMCVGGVVHYIHYSMLSTTSVGNFSI
jgi:hypothetical protein